MTHCNRKVNSCYCIGSSSVSHGLFLKFIVYLLIAVFVYYIQSLAYLCVCFLHTGIFLNTEVMELNSWGNFASQDQCFTLYLSLIVYWAKKCPAIERPLLGIVLLIRHSVGQISTLRGRKASVMCSIFNPAVNYQKLLQ